MTRLAETRRRRRFRRARIIAAITGFGMLGLSLFGIGIAAYAAPPAPAATPSILTPLNNSMTGDTTPDIQIFVFTDTDSTVQVYADGNPYCLMGPTGVGAYNNSCSGTALPLGDHVFTATTNYVAPDNLPIYESAPSTAVNVRIYDDSGPTFDPVASPTIDPTPSFSGTGPLGGSISQVYVIGPNTVLCSNVPVQPDGTWACTSGVSLAPGPYTIRATSLDEGGGGTFTTTGITIVTPTPPTTQQTFTPWRVSTNQPGVQGTKDTGSTAIVVESSSDGGSNWSTYCVLNGVSTPNIDVDATVWDCINPSATLQPGDNLLRAYEYDSLGMPTAAGNSITITVTTNPTVDTPADNTITNDNMPQFEGTVDAGATDVTVYEYPGDTTTFCSDLAPVAGTWSCTSFALTDGTYQYWAVAGPGQGLTAGPYTITIDTLAPPFPTITDPTDPSSTTNQHPIISGTGEPNSFVQPIVDGNPDTCIGTPGQATVDLFGNWTCELQTALTVGAHNIAAYGVDEAGNSLGPSPTQLVLTLDPAVATITADFTPWYTGNDFVQVRGTNSDNPVQLWVERADNPGGPWTPYCSVDYDVPQSGLTVWFCDESSSPGQQGTMQLGPNYLRAQVMVGGGQVSPWSAPILIQMVERPTIGSPTSGSIIADSTPTLSGTAPLEADFVDVELSGESGTLCSNVPTDASGFWSCTSAAMSDGVHSFAVATSDIGPVGADAITTITIDTTPPPFPVIDTPADPTVSASTTQTIGGSAQPGSTVTVWMNGSPASCNAGSFQPNASGRWACVVGPLAFDSYDVAASASDSLGNSTGPSATQLRLTISPFAPPPLRLVLNWVMGSFADSYHPGDPVEITGSGLPAGAFANAEIHSTPQWVGSATTDNTGKFSIAAVVPKDIEPGLHTFVVTVTADNADPSVLEQQVMIMAPVPPKAVAQTEIPKNPGGSADWQSLGDRNDPATPSVMTNSLDTIAQILGNPVFIATAGGLGLALLLFVAIPAELLNATLSEQYDRITKRIPRTKAPWWTRLKAFLETTPILGGTALTLLAAIIFGFADPGFGFDLTSLRIVIACALGLFVVGFLANAVTGGIIARRWKLANTMEIQPLGIILAVVGVVISRLLDFSPGILIGLLIGLALVGKVTKADEGRATMVKAGVVWAFAVIAWALYSILAGPLTGTSWAGNLTVETMVAITAEGLTALLIGLLPFKFLEGSAIWNYNKILWAAVWLAAAASWVLIVLPQNFGEIRGSLWIWGIIVGGFAVVALAVYFVFRFAVKQPAEDEADESESETQKVRLGRGR